MINRMIKETQRKYANISTSTLELFKSLRQECEKKRKRPTTKGVVVRPIPRKEFASRGQADLVDMQSMPRNNYIWIMVSLLLGPSHEALCSATNEKQTPCRSCRAAH